MFSVPSLSALSNSFEAARMSSPSVTVGGVSLRRSDKTGLVNYLRNEHGIRNATVSIHRKSVTVYYTTNDTHDVIQTIRKAVYEYTLKNDYTVSESSVRFSWKRFVSALKR